MFKMVFMQPASRLCGIFRSGGLLRGAAGFAVLLLALFALRGPVIRGYAGKKIASVREKYGLDIRYDRLHPSGLAGVELGGLSVVPSGGDTLFSARRLMAGLNPWKLLLLEFDLKRFGAEALRLSFIKRDSLHSNFDFLYWFDGGEARIIILSALCLRREFRCGYSSV